MEARVLHLTNQLQPFAESALPEVVELQLAAGEFHRVLQQACGNDRLVSTIRHVERSFPMEFVSLAIANTADNQILNIDEHQAISRAITRGDRDGARLAMKSHVLHLGAKVVRYLEENHFWE